MKTIQELLRDRGITPKTQFHNYTYLYDEFIACAEEYNKQFQKSSGEGDLFEAMKKIDEGNLGSAKNFIERYINTQQSGEGEMPSDEEIAKMYGATDSSEGDRINKIGFEAAQWMREEIRRLNTNK